MSLSLRFWRQRPPYSRQFAYLHVVPLPNKGNMG